LTPAVNIASLRAAAALATAIVVGGCATPPPRQPTTTVILMPDEDGHVGAVSVTSQGGTQQISEAFAASTVTGTNGKPTATIAMGRDAVTTGYDALLKAQPPKPVSFILYFHLDRTTLTDESKAQLPAVLAAVRERKPTEITIFGHADATGSEKRNLKLSADRARAIEKLLQKDDPSLDRIQVQFFGDNKPLIDSGARAEPRNRRAEVMIL
jgi:peptidoglycan-associated lipoprotein